VDITLRLPNGSRHRERKRVSHSSRSAAQRWGQDRERHLLQHGLPQRHKEVPTLTEFGTRFVEGHARANRHKPSGIAATDTIVRVHLVPILGALRLDAIGNEQVQRLKLALGNKAPKTVNNVLTVLSVLLKKAVEWGLIERMPCSIKLVAAPKPAMSFYDFEEYERLVKAAKEVDWRAELIVLLGGEAGLRSGEMVALEWRDVDLQKGISVERSAWKGQVAAPKGGRLRHVPLTRRLATALRLHRHVRGPRVMHQDDGKALTEKVVQNLVTRSAGKAGLRGNGPHILRHTFCSNLAMRGAGARAIQELAGHRSITTTQRYMHLSPAAVDGAIRLLDQPAPIYAVGDIMETGSTGSDKINRYNS
jgi:integrase